MKVTVNGEARALAGEVTLFELLEMLDLPKERVAIELNRDVIRKKDWENVIVKDSDRIEVVHFVGGG